MRAACIFVPRFPLAVELASGCAPRGRAVIIGEAADGYRTPGASTTSGGGSGR